MAEIVQEIIQPRQGAFAEGKGIMSGKDEGGQMEEVEGESKEGWKGVLENEEKPETKLIWRKERLLTPSPPTLR